MISHAKVPPMGWRFHVKETNIDLVAVSFDRLVTHLKHHWKSNGIAERDAVKEIEEQISEKHPEFVI